MPILNLNAVWQDEWLVTQVQEGDIRPKKQRRNSAEARLVFNKFNPELDFLPVQLMAYRSVASNIENKNI